MRTEIQFRNFKGLDHLKFFVEVSMIESLERFEKWRDFKSHVILSTTKARSDVHKPVFECELLLSGKGIGRNVIVKKRNGDFYQAVRSAIQATEKILRRRSKIREKVRRHTTIRPKENMMAVA